MSRGRSRAARWLIRLLLVFLLGPLLAIVVFRLLPVPLTPLMLIRLAEGYGLHRTWVGYDRISPSLVRAVIASEDNFFCREPLGIDTAALMDQVEHWESGDRARGASTITMQATRNLLLWPGRDLIRKALELWLTPQVALLWPKQRVLEVYLNIIEFGPGIYGVEAASQHYFRVHASDLTVEQETRLAVILPAPLQWSASHPNDTVLERARITRRRVGQLGSLLDCAR